MNGPGMAIIFKAPDDPAEKEGWARQMARVQFAMWVDDGAVCAVCLRPYASTDDFIDRAPRAGNGFGKDWANSFVDDACWPMYTEAAAPK